jgi:Protein of unknown function (DUF4019)
MDFLQKCSMRNFVCVLILLMTFLIGSEAYAKKNADNQKSPRQINVTSNSEPGWVPSLELERSAEAAAVSYFKKFDAEKFVDSYDMLADIFRKNATRQQFIGYGEKVAADTGGIVSRRFLKTTWTKDPLNGPFNGIFAAIDFTGKYVNAKRNCGYIVMYQSPKEEGFKVLRIENNYIPNSMANEIIKTKSQKTLDALWAQMSRSCPNYKAE